MNHALMESLVKTAFNIVAVMTMPVMARLVSASARQDAWESDAKRVVQRAIGVSTVRINACVTTAQLAIPYLESASVVMAGLVLNAEKSVQKSGMALSV